MRPYGHRTGRAALISVNEARIGVIGLGYVGLPLALEFGRRYPTVGFDINTARIAELEAGRDSTREADAAEIAAATKLKYATDPQALLDCNVYVVTVPTPVANDKRDRKSTRLNSSHLTISYAVFCLKKKTKSKSEDMNK